jgi:hypothetical protein
MKVRDDQRTELFMDRAATKPDVPGISPVLSRLIELTVRHD